MSKFQKYMHDLYRAKELVDVREERVHSIAKEVLAGMGVDVRRVGIDKVWQGAGYVCVDFSWSSRGYRDSDELRLPLSLFESENPREAARQELERREAAGAAQRRAEKQREFERLAKELAEEPR
jgi:hypothetical protein